MHLDKILADAIAKRSELDGVSKPVVDAVVREAMDAISTIVPDTVTAEQLLSEQWERCDGCDLVFLCGFDGHLAGEDAVPLCNACLKSECTEGDVTN